MVVMSVKVFCFLFFWHTLLSKHLPSIKQSV